MVNPSKLRADKKHEAQKETRKESSNVSKVVHMWENSHCQIDCYDDQEGEKCSKLNNNKELDLGHSISPKLF